VVGQPLRLLGDALSRDLLDSLGDAGMQLTAPVQQQALVGHLVRERVLERELDVRKEPDLVEELRGLQAGKISANLSLRRVGNGAAAWSSRLASGSRRSMRAARMA
jgi:hypothetical protein